MLLSPLVTAVVSDLCATGDHDCEQVCVSSPGSYTCACREGFTLNSDGKTCNGQWAGHRQPGEGGGEGMGPWPVPRKLTRASLLLASGPICNGCLLWTCGHRGGRRGWDELLKGLSSRKPTLVIRGILSMNLLNSYKTNGGMVPSGRLKIST